MEASSESAGLSRLSRIGLSHQAYRAIKDAILHGEISPGAPLNTVEVARHLGVSRTPVRQALALLNQQGFLDVDTRGQYIVHAPTRDEMVEVFLIRAVLESLSVRWCIQHLSVEHSEHLEALLRRQDIAIAHGDRDVFLSLDEQFHVGLAESAKLPQVAQFLTQLRDLVHVVGSQAITQPGRQAQVPGEHRALLDAIVVHDVEAALGALAVHLIETARSVNLELRHEIEVVILGHESVREPRATGDPR